MSLCEVRVEFNASEGDARTNLYNVVDAGGNVRPRI